MLNKVKKHLIIFLCSILLFFNIITKPLEAKAFALAATATATVSAEAISIVLDLIAAGLISVGAYELYENDEMFASVVDEYLGGITGTWDDAVNKWIPQGTDTHEGETWVLDPSSHTWEKAPSEQKVLTPDELKEWGQYGAKGVMSQKEWNEMVNRRAEEFARANHPEWFQGEETGGGGSDNGDNNGNSGGSSNNNHPTRDWKAMMNLHADTLVKIGVSAVLSISNFLDSLFSGEVDTSDSPALDEWLKSEMTETPHYYGNYEMVGDKYSIEISAISLRESGWKYVYIQPAPLLTSLKQFIYWAPSGNLFMYSARDYSPYKFPADYCTIKEYQYKPDGSLAATYNVANREISNLTSLSANIPIFRTEEAYLNFCKTGDDSGAINKEQKKLFTFPQMQSMSAKLPQTLGALATMPQTEALPTTALKEYIDAMLQFKTGTATEISPETQTETATKTMQETVNKNKTEVDTQPEEKPQPAPLPDFPDTDKITIDGSEATRDWRLVFPFCIPFDIIDLIRVLEAEPVAPYWELPFKAPAFGIDYTFVIDMSEFDKLAEIFRLCETVAYVLGLAVLTGKVIKW